MTDTSGQWHAGSSLTWDRPSSCWRTSPTLFEPDGYLTSSPTLPTSGSMRNGVCCPRPTLAPPTDDSGSGSWPSPRTTDGAGGISEYNHASLKREAALWPTPTGMDAKASGGAELGTNVTLTDRAVRMWGAPVARDDGKTPQAHLAMKHRMGGNRTEATSLSVQAKMWPTPQAHDYRSPRDPDSSRETPDLPDVASRLAPTTTTDGPTGSPKADLNPRFVAALMGVPWDWLTPSTSVATASYRQWLRQHSSSWRLEPASP